MQKRVIFFLIINIFLSCASDEDNLVEEIRCEGIIDFAPPAVFLIELLDDTGANLIENGFYSEDQIKVKLNGFAWNEKIVNSTATNIENVIALFPAGDKAVNQYLITLSQTETDTLNFTLLFKDVSREEDEGRIVCGTQLILESASYNQIEIDVSNTTLKESRPIPVISIEVIKETD